MSRNDIILGLVALVLVVFSLVVALWIPRREPDFPGRNLRLFLVVAVLLVVAMLAAVEVFGEAHEFGEGHVDEPVETLTAPDGDTGATDTGATDTGEGEEAVGDPQAGEEVYASAGCGSCHVLEAAGSSGTIGPNLDEAQPGFEEAVEQIRAGGGGMPAFGDQLSDEQIQDVAAFVVAAAGG